MSRSGPRAAGRIEVNRGRTENSPAEYESQPRGCAWRLGQASPVQEIEPSDQTEITRVVEQRCQLIKRMEPLAEENKKLKEARNLSEKNIHRAQRERDLAESNVWDLEYQNGVLTKKLAAVSEQVRSQSEQLAAVSDQLKSAFEQMERTTEQLNSVSKQKAGTAIDQLRQEKAKEAEQADKLAKELKGEFLLVEITIEEAKVQKENFDAVIAAIEPVLDYVDLEPATQHDGRRQHPNTIIQRCKVAWENFKTFNRNAITTVATHVLVVVRSHYPTIDLQLIGGGFTEGLSDAETRQLEDEVEDAAKMLAGDIDLFGETDGNGGAQ
ncbi:uncharacterized protein [Miscanthus floridulus]|uniref:uncharacterized protein n=1 Tax=Miscanthus floridulus TaxID=154761 RepID=UPI00345A64A0